MSTRYKCQIICHNDEVDLFEHCDFGKTFWGNILGKHFGETFWGNMAKHFVETKQNEG